MDMFVDNLRNMFVYIGYRYVFNCMGFPFKYFRYLLLHFLKNYAQKYEKNIFSNFLKHFVRLSRMNYIFVYKS